MDLSAYTLLVKNMEMDYKILKYVSYVSVAHNDTHIQRHCGGGATARGKGH